MKLATANEEGRYYTCKTVMFLKESKKILDHLSRKGLTFLALLIKVRFNLQVLGDFVSDCSQRLTVVRGSQGQLRDSRQELT